MEDDPRDSTGRKVKVFWEWWSGSKNQRKESSPRRVSFQGMDDVETSSSFESMALLDSDDKPDSSKSQWVKDGPGGASKDLYNALQESTVHRSSSSLACRYASLCLGAVHNFPEGLCGCSVDLTFTKAGSDDCDSYRVA
jgi:hypothetical protein